MRYAQIAGGAAVTFLEGDPKDWPDLLAADVLRPCGPEVEAGWVWDGKAFAPPLAAPTPRIISPLEFRRRFTPDERAAITLAASRGLERGDPTIQIWLDDLAASGSLDLDDKDVRADLLAMVEFGLLAPDRVTELIA